MILPAAVQIIDKGTMAIVEPVFKIRDQTELVEIMQKKCEDRFELKRAFGAALILNWFFDVNYQEQLFAIAKKLNFQCQPVINLYMLLIEENQTFPPYFDKVVVSLKEECSFLVFDLSKYIKWTA